MSHTNSGRMNNNYAHHKIPGISLKRSTNYYSIILTCPHGLFLPGIRVVCRLFLPPGCLSARRGRGLDQHISQSSRSEGEIVPLPPPHLVHHPPDGHGQLQVMLKGMFYNSTVSQSSHSPLVSPTRQTAALSVEMNIALYLRTNLAHSSCIQ